MSEPKNPLAKLDRQELLWMAGILKDACRERLEKNIISQAFEARLYRRGPVAGRLDPRPFLKIWEPRYRKFLEVATELHARLESEEVRAVTQALRTYSEPAPEVSRHGPVSAQAMAKGADAGSHASRRVRVAPASRRSSG